MNYIDTIRASNVTMLIGIGGIMVLVIGGLAMLSHHYTLNGIKSRTVGDGQHGTARWATNKEIKQTYTTLISRKENWSMVDIYADEGITGTSAEKREDFQRLMADCRRGLIDRVLVKSISRFARNTKECLEAIRELKLLGIGVYFEKENIDTATMSGEMMTALFASFAQAESESISGNMRWSYQRRMQSGEFITCKAPFGYRLRNGTLEIEESEAEIIRLIFNRYLSGHSAADIASEITSLGVPTRDGTP